MKHLKINFNDGIIQGKKISYKIGKRRDGDVVTAYADTSKIKNELNWTTKYSLENALKTAWNWELNINKNE